MKPLLLCLALSLPAFAQGPLAPPTAATPQDGPTPPLAGGAPQASMRSLFQVEPRIPVQGLSAAAPYSITQPGSYYLTDNITVATGNAISVNSDDVSIDLNGFTIKSTSGTVSGGAITVINDHSRLTVRNGSIASGTTVSSSGSVSSTGFSTGIYSASTITQALVSHVHLSGLSDIGVYLDYSGIVESCTIINCGGQGFYADEIRDCTAKSCYSNPIFASGNASNCIGESYSTTGIYAAGNANGCKGSSVQGHGLEADGNAENCTGTVTGSVPQTYGVYVFGNAINCTGTSSGGDGVHANGNATNCTGTTTQTSNSYYGLTAVNATNCTGTGTAGAGLYATGNVENCTGTSATGSGIFTTGSANNSTGTTTGSSTLYGLFASTGATNCRGVCAGSGIGIATAASPTSFFGNTTNCLGTSATGIGIYTYNATNCNGRTGGTTGSAIAIRCLGTANTCTAISNNGGTSLSLQCAIAIGCTVSGGTTSIPSGKSFNM